MALIILNGAGMERDEKASDLNALQARRV